MSSLLDRERRLVKEKERRRGVLHFPEGMKLAPQVFLTAVNGVSCTPFLADHATFSVKMSTDRSCLCFMKRVFC